jgi:AraC-like DNA-binding protein
MELHKEETEKNIRILNEAKLEKAFECLEFELIADLRAGRLSPAKMQRFPEVLDFRFSDLLAGVLSFDFLSYPMKVGTAAQKGILKKKCLTRLKTVLKQRDLRVFAEDVPEEDIYLLFIPSEKGFSENIHEELRKITESVSREFSIKLHLGVSSPFSRAEESFSAYSQAKRAAYEGRASGKAGPDDTGRGAIDRAKRFIEIHYAEDITLERVAEEVNLSPFYFSRLFKSRNGISFSDFIAHTRIDRARELLRRHPYSLKEVSAMVGYTDPNYFTRVFRKIEGTTPSRYREEMNRTSR